MNDREQKALDLLFYDGESREIKTLYNQAFKTALVEVPAAGEALQGLTDIHKMGKLTAAELLFKLWVLIETKYPGEWERLSK